MKKEILQVREMGNSNSKKKNLNQKKEKNIDNVQKILFLHILYSFLKMSMKKYRYLENKDLTV